MSRRHPPQLVNPSDVVTQAFDRQLGIRSPKQTDRRIAATERMVAKHDREIAGNTTATMDASTVLDVDANVGRAYPLGDSASAATASTNTSNTTYATVRSASFTAAQLPNGTYTIVVAWDAQFSDSVPGSLNLRLTVGSTVDTAFTLSVTTSRERLGYVRTFSAFAVSGGLTVTVEYKRDSGAGTASARNPRLQVIAVRTGG